MKKTLIVTFFAILLILLFLPTVSASEKESYTVSSEGGEYILSDTGGEISRGGLSKIISRIPSGASVSFLDVKTSESITPPRGSYIFSGSLSLTDGATLSVSEGTRLHLSSMTLAFLEGATGLLRVKGGSVRISDTTVLGESRGALLLDYSASSSLIFESGHIHSSSDSPTLRIESGAAVLCGGRITNTEGSAVRNDGSLTLLGSPTLDGAVSDIETSRALFFSRDGGFYLGGDSLSVCYLSVFSEGSLTPIAYGARDGESLLGITVYDSYGKSEKLEFFESSPHTEERMFLAVYKPYTVTLRDGEKTEKLSFISGERLSELRELGRLGYSFSGWYLDEDGVEKYTLGMAVSSSFSLYAKYELSAPNFAISSVNTVYDGRVHTLSFSSLSHPLLNEGGFFSFEWYKGGVCVGRGEALSYSSVSDSGEYECRLTFSYGRDSISILIDKIMIDHRRAKVTVPTLSSEYYTGNPLSPRLAPSSLYTSDSILCTDAGVYYLTLTLSDSENYEWVGTEDENVHIPFVILPAENGWAEPIRVYDCYAGFSPTVYATPLFGEAKILYSTSKNGEYTSKMPTEVGKYYLKAVVAATDNYKGVVGEPISFSVLVDGVVSLSLEREESYTVYTAFDKFKGTELLLKADYKSGRSESVAIDSLLVSYQTGASFRYGDSAVILSYGGASFSYPVRVERAEYDLSDFKFMDEKLIFDGGYHTIHPSGCAVVGEDGIPLSFVVSGGGRDAGEYTVTLTFITDSRNYNTPKDMTVRLLILPLSVGLTWGEDSFLYDGKTKIPSATYLDAFGTLRYATVLGGASDAGCYIATAKSPTNYKFENPDLPFEIRKADYDLSAVAWQGVNFLYDGEEHSVFLDGLPSGVFVIGYTNARAVGAGEYLASAILSYDEKNYNKPTPPTHSWQILAAEYDLSGLSFSSSESVYDGKLHYPSVIGDMPVGIDGIALSYSFSHGSLNVSDSGTGIRIVFATESENYRVPPDLILYAVITPLGINVEWEGDEFVYNGSAQAPDCYSPYTDVSVLGSGIGAGEYIATAVSLSENYFIQNSEFPYKITKAENHWLVSVSIQNFYESASPSPIGRSLYGEVVFRYFSDPKCENELSLPLSFGEYYMLAEVYEGDNFLALSSPPISFRVEEVLPISIEAELFRDGFEAYGTLERGDIAVTVFYNDGTKRVLDGALVTVKYENGDTLKRGDTRITVSAEGLSLDITVTVGKMKVDPPDLGAVVYDGSLKMPILQSDIYIIKDFEGAINSGVYSVTVGLFDSENCEFLDGGDEFTVDFEILPFEIRVLAEPLSVYRWGRFRESGFTLLSDIDLELLPEIYREIRGGKIYFCSADPNFLVITEPSSVRYLWYPSPVVSALIIVVLLLIILLIVLLIRKRKPKSPPDGNSSSDTPEPRGAERKNEKNEKTEYSEATEKAAECTEPTSPFSMDPEYADSLISDSLAKGLLRKGESVSTEGRVRRIINVDTLSDNFKAGEYVDINRLKEKHLIPSDTSYIKVLARGVLDKPLTVYANDFSLSAVKMIALTGGEAVKVSSSRFKKRKRS